MARKARTSTHCLTAADELAIANGCWFDDVAAARACEFFETRLTHSKGREFGGKPFLLQPWQRDHVIRPLFGWKRASGMRRFRSGFIAIPKKNGKSTLIAGIGLFLLLCDGEPGAEIYSAAASREQAAIVYQVQKNMVRASKPLAARLKIVNSKKRIIHERSNSFYQVLSSTADLQDGIDAHAVLIDELHRHRTRALFDVLKEAGAARSQPLNLSITTAGHNKHSICFEQWKYTQRVLAGEIDDDAHFGYIAAADRGDDPHDPATWRKANPALGLSLSLEEFKISHARAKAEATGWNEWLRLRLNLWTESEVRWLDMQAWAECGGPMGASDSTRRDFAATLGILPGEQCWGGLDLSSNTDLTAFVLVFPTSDGTLRLLPHFWIPSEAVEKREARDRVPYRQWAEQGYCKITEGATIDHQIVMADIKHLAQIYAICDVGYDPWNCLTIANTLTSHGIPMVQFSQNVPNFNEPSKEFERLLKDRKLRHGAHPVLAWNAQNVSAKTDVNGNIRPVKPDHNAAERVDGIVSAVMGTGRMLAGYREEGMGGGITIC